MAGELPSKGRCYASFLLAHTASLRSLSDKQEWIKSSASRSTIMAAAIDLAGAANVLLRAGLANENGSIALSSDLAKLSAQADRATLLGIARLLLEKFPPAWLFTAASGDNLMRELIPQDDLSVLEWMEPDFEPLILGVHRSLIRETNDEIKRRLGLAGELAVMSALRQLGHAPTHVALLSDTFGYDISCASGHESFLFEVKSSVEATKDRIFVTRNEFDVAYRNHKNWCLVQVVFSSRALLNESITARDVIQFRELSSETLHRLAQPDTATFSWRESAQFTPSSPDWTESKLRLASSFEMKI